MSFQDIIDRAKEAKLKAYKTILDESKGQIIFYGPPGTGKTHVAKELAQIITGNQPSDPWTTSTHRKIVQFHPSYSYEDFVQGIKPAKDAKGEVDYKLQPGIFQNLCKPTATQTGTDATPTTMLECAIFVLVKEKGKLSDQRSL